MFPILLMLSLSLAQAAPSARDLGAVALDDRRTEAERSEAIEALGALADPDVLWILRAAAREDLPTVQHAAIDAAAPMDHPEAVSILAWVVTSSGSVYANRSHALTRLAEHGTEAAADVLWAAASDRRVPARLRVMALDALEVHYPETLERRGVPRNVVDPLGGAAFVLANGLAGGIALSSVGTWGQFEGATAIGAVGGSAIGLGTGGLYVGGHPLTSGQGLAYASGVSWGLAAGAWTTSTAHGPWTLLDNRRQRETAADYGAAYRLVGVAGGATLGALWMSQEPETWDVLEVDLAGYLGSAVVLAGTGLIVWDPTPPPEHVLYEYPSYTYDYYGEYREDYATYDDQNAQWRRDQRTWEADHRKQAQILAASTIVGSGLGLAAGFALKEPWELGWNDAAFASTLGLEAAWVGNFTPDALGIDDTYMKGTVRLPWNAAIIGGLVLAEYHPMSLQTSAVTGTAMLSFNALGAGIPLMNRPNDAQLMAQVMIPVGLVGTTAGVLAAPWLAPGPGEWTMTGVGTAIAAAHGPMVGFSVADNTRWREDEVAGFTLVMAGATPPALLTAGHFVDPRPDDMLTLGAAFSWGAAYGMATPHAFRMGFSEESLGLSSAVVGDVFLAGTALALTEGVGLEPRHTLIPQLAGVAGGTVGALSSAMFDVDSEEVVLGGLIGATVGLVGGATYTALRPPKPPARNARRLRLPGLWQPTMFPAGSGGSHVDRVGLVVTGW